MASTPTAFPRHDTFESRHLGPREPELQAMLAAIGCSSLDDLTQKAIPASIRWRGELATPAAKSEREVLAELEKSFDVRAVETLGALGLLPGQHAPGRAVPLRRLQGRPVYRGEWIPGR